MSHPALASTAHRPWPLPRRPWVLSMRWTDLLFLHWPVDAAALQRHVPDGLAIDTFDGAAWLGVVPFVMARTRWRALPPVPTAYRFPECNLRTYVRPVAGDARPGVWFFSLDASSRLAVEGARLGFGLPYFRARMDCAHRGDSIEYRCERMDRRGPPARFVARWRPTGAFAPAVSGTLEQFLVERYCLYALRRGRLMNGDIAHAAWQLAPASCDIADCDMTRLVDVPLASAPRSALVAGPIDVAAWLPVAADRERQRL